MDVELVAFLRRYAPFARGDCAAARPVDSFAIDLHPFAHFLQSLDGDGREFAVGLRADVHEEVGIFAGSFHQIMNQFFCRFIILIGDAVAPGMVHGFTRLKRQRGYLLSRRIARFILAREVALEELEVFTGVGGTVMVVANHARRLELMDEGVLFLELPVERFGLVPDTVEPDGTDFAVVRQQLGQLVVHELVVGIPVFLALFAARSVSGVAHGVVRATPVEVRIIEMELDALLVAFVGQFFNQIPFKRRGIDDIIVRLLRVEHREAVVVARGDADILRTGGFDGRDPFRRVELDGVEARSQLRVFLPIQVLVVHHPFAVAQHTVDAVVEEDAEFVVLELFARLEVFRARRVSAGSLRYGRDA